MRRLASMVLLPAVLVAVGCGGDGGGTEAAVPPRPAAAAPAPQPAAAAPGRKADERRESRPGRERQAARRPKARRPRARRQAAPNVVSARTREGALRRAKRMVTGGAVRTPQGVLVVGTRPAGAPANPDPPPPPAPQAPAETAAQPEGASEPTTTPSQSGDSGFLG